MRIGLDISKVLAPRDGIGNYSYQLITALTALEPSASYRFYGLDQAADRQRLRAEQRQLAALGEVMVTAEPAADEVDLFHSMTWSFPAAHRGAVVYTCYDLTVLTHSAFHTVENRVHCMTGILRAHLGGATFVAISEATAAALVDELGLSRERLRVIYPAAAAQFRPLPRALARRQVRERFGLFGDFLLSVGTLEPRKNLRRLFAAYAELDAATRQRFPLVVAGGQGWRHAETERYLADQPRLRDRVLRLGRVSDDDLVALYAAATLFVYPSLAEGFGLPVAEAMACGAAVLTSNVASLPEVAGEAAWQVDPGDTVALRDAIGALLGDGDERRRLRRLAPEQAARFSWQKAAREILQLYRQLR